MNSETFGEYIRRLRIEKGLTIRELSHNVDLDQSTMSKIERNEVAPPQRIIKPLSHSLQLIYKELQIKYLSEKLYYELRKADYHLESLAIAQRRLEKEKAGTSQEIMREQLLQKIKNYLVNKPIEKAWIFGSFARQEEGFDSDVDLLVRFHQPNKLDLFDYVGFTLDLEEITGRQVDLVEEGYLLEHADQTAAKEKVLIYEHQA